MAIIIRNEVLNYMMDIQPINDKIMTIAIKTIVPTTIIAVYAHTAQYK